MLFGSSLDCLTVPYTGLACIRFISDDGETSRMEHIFTLSRSSSFSFPNFWRF
jgi:hypothetical protein